MSLRDISPHCGESPSAELSQLDRSLPATWLSFQFCIIWYGCIEWNPLFVCFPAKCFNKLPPDGIPCFARTLQDLQQLLLLFRIQNPECLFAKRPLFAITGIEKANSRHLRCLLRKTMVIKLEIIPTNPIGIYNETEMLWFCPINCCKFRQILP